MEEIRAKVAGVYPPYELAINAGSDQGVADGDIVVVYLLVDVKDPDSGEHLGSIRRPQLRLVVKFAAEKYALARINEIVRGTAEPRLKQVALPSNKPFADPGTVAVEPGDPVFIEKKADDDIPF
jgi:hypothetical protein